MFPPQWTRRCGLDTTAATVDQGRFPLKPHCDLLRRGLARIGAPKAARPPIQGDDQSGRVSVSSSSGRPNAGRYRPKFQFEVARNAVTDAADLGAARLRTGQGQG